MLPGRKEGRDVFRPERGREGRHDVVQLQRTRERDPPRHRVAFCGQRSQRATFFAKEKS